MQERKSKSVTRQTRVLLLILLFLLCAIPQLLACLNGQNDPHSYSWIVPAQIMLNENHVVVHPYTDAVPRTLEDHTNMISERSAMSSNLAVLSLITGQPLTKIQFFPIGGIVLPFICYALARYVLRSTLYAGAFTLFISYEPIVTDSTYNVSEHTWGFALLFAFMLLFVKSVQEPTFRTMGMTFSIIVFAATFLSYYSAELFEIVFAFSMTLSVMIALRFGWLEKPALTASGLLNLSLACLVMFVAFDSVAYAYVVALSHEVVDVASYGQGYLEHLLSVVTGVTSQEATAFKPYYAPGQRLSTGVGLSVCIFLAAVTAAGFAQLVLQRVRRFGERFAVDIQCMVAVSTTIVVAVSSMIYLFIGAVNFLMVVLLLPLVAFYFIQRFSVSSLVKYGLLGTALILAVLHLLLGWQFNVYPNRQEMYARIEPAIDQMLRTIPEGSIVLTDIEMGGKLLIDRTVNGKDLTIGQYFYTDTGATNISFLYSDNTAELQTTFDARGYRYLMISQANIATGIHTGWRHYPPIGEDIDSINSNSSLSLIYGDGYVFLYRYAK